MRCCPDKYPSYLFLWSMFVSLLLCQSGASAEEQTWKINLKNADIREFITQVSTITGKTFILDPRIKGKVTIISNTSLNAESIYQLFHSVLRVHGYAAVDTGGVVKIVQQVLAKQSASDLDFTDNARGEELITRVVGVINTPATELVKTLRPLIPQYGHIAGLNHPNVLIISDHAENLKRLIRIIKSIDVADRSDLVVVKLKEAWVEDIVSLLEKLAPAQIGKGAKGPNSVYIVANARNNSLVMKGDKRSLEKMQLLVAQLDTASDSQGATQVIRLAHADATAMAEILKNISSENKRDKNSQNNSVKTSIQADESLNALVIKAEPTAMADLRRVIDLLDIRRDQVLIEAAIIEVSEDFTRELGTELAVVDKSGKSLPLMLTAPSGTLSGILSSLATSGTGVPSDISPGTSPLFAVGKRNDGGTSFALLLRALAKNADVNLLSTPSIMTLDNQEAKIVVGQNVPFRTGSTLTGSSGTTNPFTTIERQNVGLTLQVTPHVHAGGLVRLEVHQEVSEVDLTGNSQIGASGSADLITNTRTIDTTILVDNGEVIVLGGLIRDKTTESQTKVPLLGSIPLLGTLFRSTSIIHEKSNLLVFLRPTVLNSKDDIKAVSGRKYRTVWDMEITGTDPETAMKSLLDGDQ